MPVRCVYIYVYYIYIVFTIICYIQPIDVISVPKPAIARRNLHRAKAWSLGHLLNDTPPGPEK